MKQDETNSKSDPKPEMEAWIAPELEARVVACTYPSALAQGVSGASAGAAPGAHPLRQPWRPPRVRALPAARLPQPPARRTHQPLSPALCGCSR